VPDIACCALMDTTVQRCLLTAVAVTDTNHNAVIKLME